MQLTRGDVLVAIREFFLEERGINPSEVHEEVEFISGLELDSLDVMELLTELEERWDLRLSNGELRGIATIGDAIDVVLEKYQVPSRDTAMHR